MIKQMITSLFIVSALLVGVADANEGLTATIIGSGSPIFNEKRAGPSVLISAGETKILVDMGNGTQANLHQLGVKARDLSALFFTHHHLDHNEEFVPILINSLLGRDKVMIVGPSNTVFLTKTNLELYKEDIDYRLGKTKRTLPEREKDFDIKDIQGGESFNIGDIRISTIEVSHTIHTIAYRFDYKGQSIVITGDLTYTQDLPRLAKNADFMIIDSGGMVMTGGKQKTKNTNNRSSTQGSKKGRNGRVIAHLNLADSSLLAQQSNVKNLVYTHFTKGNPDEEASFKEIRKNYAGHVIFGEDLMQLKGNTKVQISHNAINPNLQTNSYQIVDTGQMKFYSNDGIISKPLEGGGFFGQDASYIINNPSYTDNKNGTITDNVTGLIWQQGLTEKLTYAEALEKINNFNLAGHSDWRVPTIKELYSLIQFTGSVKGEKAITPFINTEHFSQPLGDTSKGEREIDAQVWSSTEYVGKTMNKDDTVFGVNFVDGRIKGYPKYNPRTQEPNKMYFRLVRENTNYGKNDFINNENGTVSDKATGLTWQQTDSLKSMNWEEALQYAENLTLGGYSDWRLPNAKELHSIVDYTRSPETSDSAAIDSIFQISTIRNEGGETDYPYFWTSTTHLDGPTPEKGAVYFSFGRALGKMHGNIMDVHGAGAQRSDPKTGKAMSRGPQGDMIRVDNYVRVVRGGVTDTVTYTEKTNMYSVKTNRNKETNIVTKSKIMSSLSNRFINRLDKDGDGRVSKSEFKGNEKQFKRFDTNHNGYISVEEAPIGPPKRR